MGDYISVETPDGVMRSYIAQPQGPARASVVVLQEIFGVNKDMRETCEWLASQGFIALSPDLFWRQQPGVDLSDGSEEEWKKAIALYTAFDRDLGVADAACAIRDARSLAGASGKAGVMGFCLGGLLTFRTAALHGADAAVAYYGGSTENYLAEAQTLRSPLLMHLAQDDEYMPQDAQKAIRAALAGRPNVEVYGYPGCQHAFARRNGAHYDTAAATLANERTLRFLYQHLG